MQPIISVSTCSFIITLMSAMTVECWVGVREFSILSGNKNGSTLVAKISLETPSFLWVNATLKIPAEDVRQSIQQPTLEELKGNIIFLNILFMWNFLLQFRFFDKSKAKLPNTDWLSIIWYEQTTNSGYSAIKTNLNSASPKQWYANSGNLKLCSEIRAGKLMELEYWLLDYW